MLDTTPTRFRHWSLPALGVWTLLVWSARVRNLAVGDESGWWWIPAALFPAGGLLCLWAWRRGGEALGTPVRAFALVGAAYWLVRSVFVVAGDHTAGFVVVHLLLALVTGLLSGAVLARLWRFDLVPPGVLR